MFPVKSSESTWTEKTLINTSNILSLWIEEAPPCEKQNRKKAASIIEKFLNNLQATDLELRDLNLTKLPDDLFTIPDLINRLEILDISNNLFTKLPDNITGLIKLECLGAENCRSLTQLPYDFGNLKELYNVSLTGCSLNALPDSFGNLQNLKILKLEYCSLQALPNSFGNLKDLRFLDLGHNKLTSLPNNFCNLKKIHTLYLTHNQLIQLPDSFGALEALEELNLDNNNLSKLPRGILSLPSLKNFPVSLLASNPIKWDSRPHNGS